MSRAATPFPWLRVHGRLASARYWQERLTLCGAGALLLSLIAWLLGAHLVWHLGFIALGAALGFLPPLRSSQSWALRWLDTHVGLAYRTALEVPPGEDAYGLYSALHRRVERASKNLDRPSPQPWWLPLFALAFGLLLVPNVPWSAVSPLSTAPGASGPEFTPPLADDVEEPAGEEPEGGEEEGPEAPEAPADAGGPEGQEGAGEGAGSGQDGRAPEGETGSEREALEDFLRSLDDEDESPSGSAPTAAPGEPESAEERGGLSQAREADSQDEGRDPGEGQEGGEPAEEGEGQEGGEPAEEGESQVAEAGEEGEGTPQSQAQEGEEAVQEESEEGEGGAGETGEELGAEDAPGDEPAESAGDDEAQAQGQPGSESGQEPPGDSGEGDFDDGGGAGAEGRPQDGEAFDEGLEREAERPEFLPGQRDDAGLASSGVVRLPGGGQAEGPSGATPAGFDRGVERAITEGRIPVEYHEVLRDYFR